MRNKGNKRMTTRKTYQKPQLEHVQLVSEEAVLLHCKTRDGGQIPVCKNKNVGCNKTSAGS